ncbi:hypothetical protein [Prosthecobacter vanneervenii]|uniref:Uncharacterized protein n=1 Tax=Prosthecobacter vanneervenii TaxID=48466 RepID=A0A7W7YCM5_9BACT|nr:hypothetical protein [Prosthecobacter vanneervenii]MBB5033704.1 hypothetical protein [Prosthecobacter vanneervenii]
MKTTACFLFFTLLTALAEADDRLIPFDEFYLSVPVNKEPKARGLRLPKPQP